MTGGAYQQNDSKVAAASFAGDHSWSDYTLVLKARKLAGAGALIITVCDDGAGARAQWVLGGWNNREHGIVTHFAEQDQLLARVPGGLEANRWYDVKIALNGARMDCYLDGQLIQSASVLHRRVPELFTSATRDEATGEIILKVVNPTSRATQEAIQLRGVPGVEPIGRALILSGDLADENSFADPTHIAPSTQSVADLQPEFTYTFKSHSLTILRLRPNSGSRN